MFEFIDRLRAKQSERQMARIDDWNALVTAVADGRDPDADQAAQILEETNRTPEDLQAAVERMRERRGLAEIVATRPQVERKRDQARQRLQEAQAEWRRVKQELDDTVAEREREFQQASHDVQSVLNAAKRLRDTADPALHARLREINQERSSLTSSSRHDAQLELDRAALEEELKAAEQLRKSDVPALKDRLQRIEHEIERRSQSSSAKVVARVAELDAEQPEIERRIIDPLS